MVGISCWFLPFCDVRASHILQMAFSLLEFHLAGLRVCPCVLSEEVFGVGCEMKCPWSVCSSNMRSKSALLFPLHLCAVGTQSVIFHVCPCPCLHVSLDTFPSHSAQIFHQFALFV